MSLKEYIVPVTLESFHSQYNQDIQVISFLGKVRLDMGGLTQSGDIIEHIWSKAIRQLIPTNFYPQSILILGVGGGSSARFIYRRWPKANIIGVEIDPEVIRIARQYFNVDALSNFSIINLDAIKFINQLPDDSHFDIIMVDCYQGDRIPSAFNNIKFLQKLKKISTHLLLNRLFWNGHQKVTTQFLSTISPHFTLSTCRTPSNLVVSLRSR